MASLEKLQHDGQQQAERERAAKRKEPLVRVRLLKSVQLDGGIVGEIGQVYEVPESEARRMIDAFRPMFTHMAIAEHA
jgi:hypothetical protein